MGINCGWHVNSVIWGTCDNCFEVAISLHRILHQVHHSQLCSADSYDQWSPSHQPYSASLQLFIRCHNLYSVSWWHQDLHLLHFLLTKLSMKCTPREAFENHTGEFDHCLSFLSTRVHDPLAQQDALKGAVHKLLLGNIDLRCDKASASPFLAAYSDLPVWFSLVLQHTQLWWFLQLQDQDGWS